MCNTLSKHHAYLTSLRSILSTILYWVQLVLPSKLYSRITSCMKLPFDEGTCVWFYLGKYILLCFNWLICIFSIGFEVLSPKTLKGKNVPFCFLPFYGVTNQKVWFLHGQRRHFCKVLWIWLPHEPRESFIQWFMKKMAACFFPWLKRQETEQQWPNSMETPPVYWHHGNFA